MEIEVYGAQEAREVGRRLRAAGLEGRGLRRELLAEMRALEKPLVDVAKKAAEDELPKGGGLNRWPRFAARNRLSGMGAGVRIVGTHSGSNHNLARLDYGTARHPVYGHRDRWSNTKIPVGWFTKALQGRGSEIQLALLTAMRRTTSRI